MVEESEKSKGITSIMQALLSFIHPDMREFVGFFIGLFLAVGIPACIVLGVMTLYHTMQKSKANNVACWQIQVLEKRAFKLNTCTGELTEVAELPPPIASGSQK